MTKDEVTASELVTIGMPVFNGEENLGRALDSLLKQTYENFEIIISDNASTDRTREICLEYREADPRVRYFRNEENIGALANFNKLIHMGSGTYFMWAAIDDLWEPDFIAELVGLLEDNPSALVAFCNFNLIDRLTTNTVEGPSLMQLSKLKSPLWRAVRLFLMPEPYHKATLIYGIFRTDAIRRIGGIYSGYRGCSWSADNHTLLSVSLQGRFVLSDRLLFHKGYISGTVQDISHLPTFRDIHLSFMGYVDQIKSGDLNNAGKLFLLLMAFINHSMNIFGKIAVSVMVKWNLDRYTKRFYRKLLH